MYPPVGVGQVREAMTDVNLAGKLSIPKGVLIWVPHLAMHTCKHNWEEPHVFNPGKRIRVDSLSAS